MMKVTTNNSLLQFIKLVKSALNGKANSTHTHNYAGSSSAGGAANSANKLATARTIGLGTGVTSTATSFDGSGNITIPVHSVKESYLEWGGKSISGGISPIDAAVSNLHSANRFAFAKAAGITIEYSTDGGSTYSVYSTTDAAKINLVSGIGSSYYIGARSTSTTINDKLRITLNATNMGLYTKLRKILINISTDYATGSNVTIEKSMKGSESTYATIGNYSISGWSGWNSIPITAAFGGGSKQTANIATLRFTFGITGINSNQTLNALQILDIIGIGDTYWSYPSAMAKTGHLYSYDSSQNATFPAKVTAASFSGATATTSANGLMSSTDKKKLDGIATGANKYSLPTATSSVLGGVKVGSNITNSSGTISLTKANVTSALGYTPPTTNTTYSVATTSKDGLMSSTDKKKLDGINASGTFTLDGTTLNITSTSTIFSLSGTTLTITSE